MSIIISIDPGPEESAYCILENGGVKLFNKTDNKTMRENLIGWSQSFDDASLVIEMISSFGMPVGAEVFETVFWSGRFAEAWGREFARLKRHEIKMHLCQNMRAKDGNIRAAIIDRFGGKDKAIGRKATPGPLYKMSGDCWAALAVALTFIDLTKEIK